MSALHDIARLVVIAAIVCAIAAVALARDPKGWRIAAGIAFSAVAVVLALWVIALDGGSGAVAP